ncbi:MAG TPA: DUF3299 domain-containing protein [Tepidisphaeraceae bacterium]|nr:DUF3299 domain-containing protein [Tepidisphaeraceae bacterium]
MRKTITLVVLSLVASALGAVPTTVPSVDRGALEVRANEEFNRGQYAMALPILQKLAEMLKDQPDLVGPIQEKIRVCQKNIAAAPAPAAVQSVNNDRKPHPTPKDGQVLEMNIKDLGNFDFDADKGGNIPADVKQLSGHPIKLHGFMVPMDQAANITQFALVPDLFACCFGQPPQLQHTIICNTPRGKAVSYYPDEIQVEGKLTVAEKKDEGFIVSIFQVDVSSVKPTPK